MTLREIIFDIKEIIQSYSDDSSVSEEHLAFIINNKRNLLLRQFLSNLKKPMPKEAMQLICLNLEDDPNCTEDRKLLRSTIKVPATMQSTGRSNIVKAFSSDISLSKYLNVVDYHRFPFVGSERFNTRQIYITVDPDSYLKVYNPKNLHLFMEEIQIEGIFENPEEAYDLSCNASANDCDFFDAQYPIESSLIDPIKSQILNEFTLKLQVPQDTTNDGEDNQGFSDVRIRRSE